MGKGTPLTVVAGYLGAGKTTLLNKLLRESEGKRITVLVNDFGDINIDARLIESRNEDTIHLTNGCVCCSISDGLAEALGKLAESDDPPDHIVLEASGVAEPSKLVGIGASWPSIDLIAIVVLVDAETLPDRISDKFVGGLVKRQIRSADLVILNKIDLVATDDREQVAKLLTQISPGCRVLESIRAALPRELVFEDLGGAGNRRDKSLTPGNLGDSYQTWSYVSDRPMVLESVQRVIEDLPDEILRAKGFINLAGDHIPNYLLQAVGRRRSLEPWPPSRTEESRTEIVFIAPVAFEDRDRVKDMLDQCCEDSGVSRESANKPLMGSTANQQRR